jgi:hypothetical protein
MTLVARIGGRDLTKEEYFEKYCVKGDCDEKGNSKYYFVGDKIYLKNIHELKVKFKSIWKYVLIYLKNILIEFNDDDSNDSDDGSNDSDDSGDDYVIM